MAGSIPQSTPYRRTLDRAAGVEFQLSFDDIVCRWYRTRHDKWFTGVCLYEEAVESFHVAAHYPALRSIALVVDEKAPRGLAQPFGRFLSPQEADLLDPKHMPEGYYVLSLLDIAVVSGDAQKAAILHSIGVPQRCGFRV